MSIKIEARSKRDFPFFYERPTADVWGTHHFQHCMVAERYTHGDPIECEGLDSRNCFVERYKEVIVIKAPSPQMELDIEEKG